MSGVGDVRRLPGRGGAHSWVCVASHGAPLSGTWCIQGYLLRLGGVPSGPGDGRTGLHGRHPTCLLGASGMRGAAGVY